MVECKPSKLDTRVRLPSLAPLWGYGRELLGPYKHMPWAPCVLICQHWLSYRILSIPDSLCSLRLTHV